MSRTLLLAAPLLALGACAPDPESPAAETAPRADGPTEQAVAMGYARLVTGDRLEGSILPPLGPISAAILERGLTEGGSLRVELGPGPMATTCGVVLALKCRLSIGVKIRPGPGLGARGVVALRRLRAGGVIGGPRPIQLTALVRRGQALSALRVVEGLLAIIRASRFGDLDGRRRRIYGLSRGLVSTTSGEPHHQGRQQRNPCLHQGLLASVSGGTLTQPSCACNARLQPRAR